MFAIACFAPATTLRVEALPLLNTVIKVLRTPSCRTMFCCGSLPSRTWATSLRRMIVPSATLIGRSFKLSIFPGKVLTSIGYWIAPNLVVPLGKTSA